MASIRSKVIILFMLACMSTLSSANESWFRGRNCTFPFKPRHRRHRSPPPSRWRRPPSPPPSRYLLPPPSRWRRPPSPPPSRYLSPPPILQRPPTPPPRRLPLPPPPILQRPPTSPPRRLPLPPPPILQRPPTPPPQRLPLPPPPPQRPRTPPPSPTPQSPKKIIVGGSEHWRLGFDYNDWALKNGPFYLNDILVFKYDPPNGRAIPPHNVYLLPNMQSFVKCDFRRAKMMANLTQGSGNGFEFVLKQQNPYYFACGEGNGFHCNSGSMKFSITPQSRHSPLGPPPSPPPPSRRPRTPPSQQAPPSSPSLSPPPSPTPQGPRKIIVGGSEHWRLGFDYNDWTLKNSPFYLNDILVFKYDHPNSSTPPHNVYLLPNMQSFVNCDFGRAKMVANLTQGSGVGFQFVVNQQIPYYFACGEGNGFHCKLGSMKFSITPQLSRLPLKPPSPPSRLSPPSLSPSLPPPSPSQPPSSPSPSPSPLPSPQSPRKITVGGSKYWNLGFDYNDWAIKNGPFYLNDILVFKYDRPNKSTPPHNVYLLPNMQSFANCDFGKAKMVANLIQGSGDGFEFELNQQITYYFACGEGNGFHCKLGSMKFSVTPTVQR